MGKRRDCVIALYIYGHNVTIVVGNGCHLHDGTLFISGNGKGNRIVIGDGTTLGKGFSVYAQEGKSVEIGKDCMFSTGVTVRNSDSHPIIDTVTLQRCNLSEDIIIGNHVWVGQDAYISKGTVIEDDVIVGAKSVCVGLLREKTIYAGVPARKVAENRTWKRHFD